MTAPTNARRNAGRRGRTLAIVFGATALGAMAAAALALLIGGPLLRRALKRNIVATLQKRFESYVQIDELNVSVFPHISAVAQGIVLRTKDHPDPPLITIRKLSLSASLFNLLRRHVSGVYLEGLQIRIPPSPQGSNPPPGIWAARKVHFVLVIDEIVSKDALLETLPRDAGHVPRDFMIHSLALHSFSFENPSPFLVTLTNPVPAGEIDSAGQFGPWKADQPGDTPVSGTFRYAHADFSSIKGLSGIMSSQGSYSGSLDRIDVQGTTEMPDFALAIVGNPMRLLTRYVAVVDGTNGNTYLTSVDARLGNSPIHVSGQIVGVPGVHGRKILLDASSHDARAEDLTHLAVKGPPPLRGTVNLRTKIYLPPIPKGADAIKLTSLDGQFDIADARFTGQVAQGKVDSLSRAGQGQPKSTGIQNVPFDLRGKFIVNGGVAHLSQIAFDLQGASVQIDGSYRLDNGDMDFRGRLQLDAKASQATTGIKSVMLRPFDRFFEKNGKGFSIPFKVSGDRDHPLIRP
jgi:hypothetical protein